MEVGISANIFKFSNGLLADPPPPELIRRGHRATVFYNTANFVVPIIAATSGLICTIAFSIFCYKHRKLNILRKSLMRRMIFNLTGQSTRSLKETLENRQNIDVAQRERYYATIHKVALQTGEKIPGKSISIFRSTSSDIILFR